MFRFLICVNALGLVAAGPSGGNGGNGGNGGKCTTRIALENTMCPVASCIEPEPGYCYDTTCTNTVVTSTGSCCCKLCDALPCTTDPVCGNGIKEGDEECDDGNALAGDGCSPNCLSEATTCSGGQVYTTCLRSCVATCDEPNPICTMDCNGSGCQCPSGQVLENGQCIDPSECPSGCSANPVKKCKAATCGCPCTYGNGKDASTGQCGDDGTCADWLVAPTCGGGSN